MKNLVFMSCIICALVVSVFSVKCYSCLSETTTTCNVTVVDCLGEKCMTVSQNYTHGNKSIPSVMKGCANDEICGGEGQVEADIIRFGFYASCCTGNECNSDGHRMPEDDRTPNGLQCESCFKTSSTEECVSTKKINCTGSQNECFAYTGVMKNPLGSVMDYSLKGCANNFTCKFNIEKHIGAKFLFGKGMNCFTPHPKQITPKEYI